MASTHLDYSLADKMVTESIHSFANDSFHGDVQQALSEIHQGNCEVCGAVAECLARQIASFLAQAEPAIKVVYRYGPDSDITQDSSHPYRKSGINLLAWSGRKNTAFNSLASSIIRSLSDRRRRILCRNATPACQVIEIQLVDDKDVAENRGQAVLVNSPLIRSQQVWNLAEKNGSSEAQLFKISSDP